MLVAPGTGPGPQDAVDVAGIGPVGPGEPVFVQVSPGNVASLRAVLAVGYEPIGAEVMLFRPHSDPQNDGSHQNEV